MSDIAFATQILLSIVFPALLYFSFGKEIKKSLSSNTNGTRNTPGIYFRLKRWWAECCVVRLKKTAERENLSTLQDENSCNSILFYGADQKGNSLFCKFAHTRHRIVEVILQLATADGRLYVLPEYPDTTFPSSLNQKWRAGGLKIECLEAEQRWRISYNGMLWNIAERDTPCDESFEHVRLNVVFIGIAQPIKWPDDWSSKLHADALARDPWRDPGWIHKIKLLDHKGFDQWGSMIGQITYKDSSISALYLRGLHQYRTGKHESHQFQKADTIFGIMSLGDMFCLGITSTKHSFPIMQFGHVRDSNEIVHQVDWTDIELSNFTEHDSPINLQRTSFEANGRKYSVQMTLDNSMNWYCGRPRHWLNQLVHLKIELNGRPGIGIMQLHRSYDGPSEAKPCARLQHLKQPNTCIQKDDYILSFNDEKCLNENIVGGKGYSLAVLTSIEDESFSVPAGFCVTVFAFELQLQMHEELQRAIDDIESISTRKKDGDLEKYCKLAVDVIGSTAVAKTVRDAILKGVEQLESRFESNELGYAIRSSAVGEDSEETSAAGQNTTYLGVRGADNIVKSVARCWASLFTYQSVQYRRHHGLSIKASMGVCVQRIVNAESAGVLFTRHPTTGDPSTIVITANYGLGETVVSAMVDPDTITLHRSFDDRLTVKDSTLGNRSEKISISDGRLARKSLDQREIQNVCISEETAIRLGRIGVSLERLFGTGRDIEWAVDDDKIFLLQARPITTLHAWTDFELVHELDTGVPSDTDIFTFANVGEVLPNPVSPLGTSTSIKILNQTRQPGVKGEDRNIIYLTAFRCTISYYNTFMQHVGREITLMNKIVDIGICGKVVVTPEIHKIALERKDAISGRRQIYLMFILLKEIWQNSAIQRRAEESYRKLTLNEDQFNTAYSLYNEIDKKWDKVGEIVNCHSFTSRVSISYQMFAMAFLMKGYEDLTADHFSDIGILLSSHGSVVSADVPRIVNEIAKYIKDSGKAEEFRKLTSTDAFDWMRENCLPAFEKLELLLKEQGHRCIQELDIASEPWSLKPESLIATIQELTKKNSFETLSRALNVDETMALLKTPKSSFIKWILKKIIPHSRNAVMAREMTKSIFVHTVHKFKLAYRKLAKLMVSEGCLPSEDLIFFLTHKEIKEILRNRNNTSLVQKAQRRRMIFPRLKQLEYPEINIGMPTPIETDLTGGSLREGCTKLHGTSAFGGSVLARACVITDLSEAKNIESGDILITHSTDIGWSPYFPLLSGIVTELGGLISHGAVVAREYGLPCVIGVTGATSIFQTGDTVLLAADAGILQMIKKSD